MQTLAEENDSEIDPELAEEILNWLCAHDPEDIELIVRALLKLCAC